MASRHRHHDDALWAKLHDLEVQLAAYKLLRAVRGDREDASAGYADGAAMPAGGARRGRQYDAYMRRRDARRVAAAASAVEHQRLQELQTAKAAQQQARAARVVPVSPRALRCAARDVADSGAAATPRLAVAQAKRAPLPAVSVPTTPRRDAAALPRSRTANSVGVGGAAGSPARPSHHHHRRSSLGALAELGEGAATPRPFLRRGTGTGGAGAGAAPSPRLRTTRVHDLSAIDVSSTPRSLPLLEPAHGHAHAHAHALRHARSVSELPPFDTAALASPQSQARAARKRWGSPERPAAMYSAVGESHRDLSKGLRKLLSFVRKGGRSGSGGEQQLPFPAPSPRGGGKPVSKGGWSGCSLVDDVPFDRASLEAHRFPMTRAVGISG
ncbi:unnamed protein product [Urochloa humidicola]